MRFARVRRALALLALTVAATVGAGAAQAQSLWQELTSDQQTALAPLAEQWPQLSIDQQRNWMAVSHRYPFMTPRERQILQDRMTEWAALTPNQRNQARFDFNAIKSSLSAEQRRAKWEEYRHLPPEERERLARNRHMPHGTAPALRPPLPGRLAKPPMPPQAAPPVIEFPSGIYYAGAPRPAPRVLIPANHNTLLPRILPEAENRRAIGP